MVPGFAMYHEQFNKKSTIFCTQLNGQTFLFLIIQFNISNLFTHSLNTQTVLFDAYPVLPLRVNLDLESMAMKGYSTSPKTQALLEPQHQIV